MEKTMKAVKIGVVGCGDICVKYFTTLCDIFENTEIYACCDLIEERAREKAEQFHIPHIMTVEEMLACKEIDVILNLATPNTHYPINKAALLAGKHVYTEKPLAVTLEQGKELVELAKEKGLYLGGAPDTFMGAGIQTCRKMLDDGLIGRVVGGGAFMMGHGWEGRARNHPNPAFYYQKGAGPMMDMGGYYITALVSLLGPIEEIHAMKTRGKDVRIATTRQKYGQEIPVEADTHITGLLRFRCGAVVTVITSFEAWQSMLPNIELYGTEGTMLVPDPNFFGIAKVRSDNPGPGVYQSWLRRPQIATSDERGHKEWPFEFKEAPFLFEYAEDTRGVGLADMANCILAGEGIPRANMDLQLHVLEALLALERGEASYRMTTTVERPAPMKNDLIPGMV